MTSLTHTIAGLTVGSAVIMLSSHALPVSDFGILAISVFSANLPDMNVLWQHDLRKHHNDITHYPIVMISLSLILMVIEYFWTGSYLIGAIITINLIIHYCMDAFGHAIGIFPLMPFSNKEISLTRLRSEKFSGNYKDKAKRVLGMQATWAELTILVLCIFLLIVLWS